LAHKSARAGLKALNAQLRQNTHGGFADATKMSDAEIQNTGNVLEARVARKRSSGAHQLGDGDHNKRLKMAAPNTDKREVTITPNGPRTSAHVGIKLPFKGSDLNLSLDDGRRLSDTLLRHNTDTTSQLPPAAKLRRAARAGIVRPDWDELSRRSEANKPRQLLCDRLLSADMLEVSQAWIDRSVGEDIRKTLRIAHRVVFDDDAAARLGEVVASAMDLVQQHETFARQPWDPMWLEFASHPFAENVSPRLSGQVDLGRIGLLFVDHTSVMVDSHRGDKGPLIAIHQCHLHRPKYGWWKDFGIEEAHMRNAFGGAKDDRSGWDPVIGINSHHFSLIKPNPAVPDAEVREYLSRNLENSSLAFQLMVTLATLLLLNRPSLVRYHAKPGGRTFVKGKLRPYMSHTTLHFALDPKESLHAMRNEQREIQERVPLRWHSVRGHYCHSKEWREYGSIGCIHTPIQTDEHWTPMPDLPPLECSHWVCSQCEGRRWRREYKNGRGSAAVGFVNQDMTIVEGPKP